MDIVFRRILQSSPREEPPGEWHLRACDPHTKLGMAQIALQGPAGFVGGSVPNPNTIVVQDDPTFDDLLAVLFLTWTLPTEPAAQASAQRFAEYAASARKGFLPARKQVSVEETIESVFEVMRHVASGYRAGQKKGEYQSLTTPGCRERFLASWHKLANLIQRKIEAGVDPHRQSLFDDSPDFVEELSQLKKDRANGYIDDRNKAPQFLIQMRDNGRYVPALIVKHRHSFTPWRHAWADTEAPDLQTEPADRHYHLFATIDPDQGWVISTDPSDNYDLRGLAEVLQKSEDKAAKTASATEPKREWRALPRDEPDRPAAKSILFAPIDGTRLSEEAVIGAIKAWGKWKPVEKQTAPVGRVVNDRSWPKWVPAVAVVVLIGGFLAWMYRPVPPDPTPPGPIPTVLQPVALTKSMDAPNSKFAVSQAQKLPESLFDSSSGNSIVQVDEQATKRVASRLMYAGKDRPTENVALVLPAAEKKITIAPAQWKQGPDQLWRAGDFHLTSLEKGKQFHLAAPNHNLELFSLEHLRVPEMHLHIMAVGISEYSKSMTGQDPLAFAAKDADALMDQFCSLGETLYTEIHTYGPKDPEKLRSRALKNAEATSGNIKKLLVQFRDGVDQDIQDLRSRNRKSDEKDAEKKKPAVVAVVIFCGHGIAHTKEEFKFIASNFQRENEDTRVTGSDIDGSLKDLDCDKILVFDCCHSGLMVQSRGDTPAPLLSNENRAKAAAEFAAELSTGDKGRFLLSACQRDKLAYESAEWGPSGDKGHGALTAAVLLALNEARARGEKTVTLHDLHYHASRKVKELTKGIGDEQSVVPDFSNSERPQKIPIAYFGDAEQRDGAKTP